MKRKAKKEPPAKRCDICGDKFKTLGGPKGSGLCDICLSWSEQEDWAP